MELEDLRIFVATIETGSFTLAAERLGVTKQSVSRRTMALEAELDVRLLNRTTRRLSPTDAGLRFHEHAQRVLAELESARNAVCGDAAELVGVLRLSAPMSFGIRHLGTLLPRFLTEHGRLRIELDLSDRRADLLAEGYDMAIRIGALEDSTLVARRIAQSRLVPCASPAYLARRGTPAHPSELSGHDCLPFGSGKTETWSFKLKDKPYSVAISGALRANNGEILRDAAVAGLGIAYLPYFIVQPALAEGQLVPLFDEDIATPLPIYAIYPRHRQTSRPVLALTQFLIEALKTEMT